MENTCFPRSRAAFSKSSKKSYCNGTISLGKRHAFLYHKRMENNELKIGSELKNGAVITGIQTRADGSQGMWIVTRSDGSTCYRPRRPDKGTWANFKWGNPTVTDHPANPRYKLD